MKKNSVLSLFGCFAVCLLVATLIYSYVAHTQTQNNTVYHFDGATIYWIE